MPKSGPQPYADCKHCEWDHYGISEQDAVVAETLHLLTKHPDEYQRLTGKDPEIATLEHYEMIQHYRKVL